MRVEPGVCTMRSSGSTMAMMKILGSQRKISVAQRRFETITYFMVSDGIEDGKVMELLTN